MLLRNRMRTAIMASAIITDGIRPDGSLTFSFLLAPRVSFPDSRRIADMVSQQHP
jgi:hypothetical protein